MSSQESILTWGEILTIVNRYIGVSGGYLGDFSYRTHAEFYPEYCNLDINPYEYGGTTRERFMQIVSESEPRVQAKILGGVLKKYPVGSTELRTQETYEEIQEMIGRLENLGPVASPTLTITSDVVERAINDAETLLKESGATSGVDRVHTALHGYLEAVCNREGMTYKDDASLTELFKLLRQLHPALVDMGAHSTEMLKVLRSLSAVLDALSALRNRGSVAHPNPALLDQPEAMLCINVARTILHYFDAKFSDVNKQKNHS